MGSYSLNFPLNAGDPSRFGDARTSSLSPNPQILEPYADWRRGVQVPGTTVSQFGGKGPSNPLNINIYAMDSRSVIDHAPVLADAISLHLNMTGGGALGEAIKRIS